MHWIYRPGLLGLSLCFSMFCNGSQLYRRYSFKRGENSNKVNALTQIFGSWAPIHLPMPENVTHCYKECTEFTGQKSWLCLCLVFRCFVMVPNCTVFAIQFERVGKQQWGQCFDPNSLRPTHLPMSVNVAHGYKECTEFMASIPDFVFVLFLDVL